MLGLTPTWAIWCNGNIPKFRWNRGGITSSKTCNISETVQGYYDGLIGSRICALDCYQNQWPWTT